MKKKLLLILAVAASTCFALPYKEGLDKTVCNENNTFDLATLVNTDITYIKPTSLSLFEVKEILSKEAPTLNATVINKVITTLKCAAQYNIGHNNVLTVIDYSLPSSEKRLWVFDLKTKKLLFNTYVSHGLNSGISSSQYFSNKNNSKATSMGVYKTDQPYYGRHGLSLKLDGLDRGFNDNAASRAVVMHGGWYVEDNFIKRYGRAGRSWGCPAIPDHISKSLINTIKGSSLFVAYYPSDNWLLKSKFQTCDKPALVNVAAHQQDTSPPNENKVSREDILFADINKNNRREENEPVVVMMADNYERAFHTKAPLERMLRRQINNAEYIALTNKEFNSMVSHKDTLLNDDTTGFKAVSFVIPVIKMEHGYYATEMQFVPLGKIKEVTLNSGSTTENPKAFTVDFEPKSGVSLKTTNGFIRWLGL